MDGQHPQALWCLTGHSQEHITPRIKASASQAGASLLLDEKKSILRKCSLVSCLSLSEWGLGSLGGFGRGSGTGPSHGWGLDPSWSSTNTPNRQLLAAKHRLRASSGKFDFGQPFPGFVGIDAAEPRSHCTSH